MKANELADLPGNIRIRTNVGSIRMPPLKKSGLSAFMLNDPNRNLGGSLIIWTIECYGSYWVSAKTLAGHLAKTVSCFGSFCHLLPQPSAQHWLHLQAGLAWLVRQHKT